MAQVLNYEPPPNRLHPPLAFARAAAVAVIALGTMALVGWITDIEILKSFLHPGKIAMNPATAACFILAGTALGVSVWQSRVFTPALRPGQVGPNRSRAGDQPRSTPPGGGVAIDYESPGDLPPRLSPLRQGVAIACATVVVTVALLKLLTFFGFWNVGVDRVLFRDRLGTNVMAPNTAFNFLLVGAALLLLDVTVLGRLRPARLLTLCATAVALLALIGYLYDVTALYKPTQKYIAMALNTAMGFLALSLGLLAARPDREPIRTLISDTAGGVIARRLLPAALLLPIVLGWLHLRAVGDEAMLDHVGFPVMITTLLALVTLVSLTWGTARSLHRVDVERARAERAAADNLRLMRTLIDNLPNYIFVKDKENRFLLNNAAHVRVLGAVSPEQVLGKRDEDFFRPELAVRYHHDDAEVIRTGQPQIDKEERVVTRDGTARWALTTKVPLRDAEGDVVGLVGIAHDITQRKQAEEERDRFFVLSIDMMCVAGLDGYFKRVNPAVENILGYTAAEMTSRPWIELVHPDDVARTIAESQKLAGGAITLYFENRYLSKEGRYKWIAWAAVPVVAEGLMYCVGRDMTQQKAAEAQLRLQNELLDQSARSEREAHEALKQAQSHLVQNEKLASLGQMVAGVAHEINNPLSFVANNVAVLQRDLRGLATMIDLYRRADPTIGAHQPDLAAELRETAMRLDVQYTLTNVPDLLTRSREGLRRIQQIVKDLRDFARLDESDLHDVDLNEGIRSTVNIILGVAKKRQVKVEMELNPLPRVSCYPAKVNQVVMNLLANAIHASHEGGTVAVRSFEQDDAIKIQVADQGAGIPDHIRSRIFDPFFTTKPPGEGTGLGLSISYGIIQNHGGRIDVETETGKGSTFTVTLPLQRLAQVSDPRASETDPVATTTQAPPA